MDSFKLKWPLNVICEMILLHTLPGKLLMPRLLVHFIVSVVIYCILVMTEIIEQVDLE